MLFFLFCSVVDDPNLAEANESGREHVETAEGGGGTVQLIPSDEGAVGQVSIRGDCIQNTGLRTSKLQVDPRTSCPECRGDVQYCRHYHHHRPSHSQPHLPSKNPDFYPSSSCEGEDDAIIHSFGTLSVSTSHHSAPVGSRSQANIPRSCREEATNSMASLDDTTVDDLAGYLDEIMFLPKPMSEMAELMYT